MSDYFEDKLFVAVCSGDIEKIKSIISRGADNNHGVKIWSGESTFLHYAPTAEVVKELLLHGASVNAKDYNGSTPLQIAVTRNNGLSIVRELLKNGADPNARNFHGTTALTPAIIRQNIEIIMELLDYGADINIRTTSPLLRYPTPLAVAVSAYQDCAKILIKITLVRNFNSDYKKVINLDLYTECDNYNILSKYLDDCVCEIVQMKTEKANVNLTLHDFVLKKTENIKSLYVRYKVADEQLSKEYPIYHDMIITKIKLFLKRAYVLEKLRLKEMHIYLNTHRDNVTNTLIVNPDCLRKIAEYLCNNDLFQFAAALDKNIDPSCYS